MKHGYVVFLLLLSLTSLSSGSSHHDGESILPHDATPSDHGLGTILFLSGTFLIGALTRHIIHKFCPGLPYTVTLLAIGLLIGVPFKMYEAELHGYVGLMHIDPHLLMYIFLPVLLFESAFLLDIHALKKSIGQVLLLAIPGYLLSSVLTAIVIMYIIAYDWTFDASMMVGAIISATDPVAVVALLKNSPGGKDVHHLSIVIEGESLLNDGAAIVLFNIFQDNAMAPCADNSVNYTCTMGGHLDDGFYVGGNTTIFSGKNVTQFCDSYSDCYPKEALHDQMCTNLSSSDIVIDVARKTIGGPLIGLVVGYIMTFWLGKVFNDSLTEITITVGSPYLVYYISEMFLKSSGVLSVVTFGIVVNFNKMNISPEIESFLNKFWEQMGFLVNTIIFLVVGIIITFSAVEDIEPKDIVYLIVLYLGISLSRTVMLALFHFFLSRMGYGLTLPSACVLMWGALRGAVSLALALQVHHNFGFCDAMRAKVLFFVSGIVVLTLLINSTTFNKVLHVLGFCHISKAKKSAVDTAAQTITDTMNEALDRIKKDAFLSDSHWKEVEKICCIDTIYNKDKKLMSKRDKVDKLHDEVTACENCSSKVPVPLTKAELSEFYDESRNRVLKAFKISLWNQFDSGLLTKPALRFLDDMCDQTQDIKDKFIDLEDIEFTWQIGHILQYMRAKLASWQKGRKCEEYPIPNNINQYKVYQFVSSQWFDPVILFFIFCNVVIVIVELSISSEKCLTVKRLPDPFTHEVISEITWQTQRSINFGIVNYCFLVLFILEMVLKVIGQRKYYFYDKWNLIDFGIILISLADSLTDIFAGCNTANINFNIFRVIRIVRLFRCVRLIKWILVVLNQLVKYLINRSLSSGYDIGVGYLVASDEVIQSINHVVSSAECQKSFTETLLNTQAKVVHSLGILRKEYPGIPIAIKTKQAIRIVLNKGRARAWKLLSDGHIDEFDSVLFTKQIEAKMKRLLASTMHWLSPQDAFGLFAEASWLKNVHEYIIMHVVKYATHQMYNEGEVILNRGEIASGVYLIISGKARVSHTKTSSQSLTEGSTNRIHKSFSSYMACHHGHNDMLGAGAIVGEQSILINRPRGSYVICETDLQCYFIRAEDMHGLMLRFPIIEERLWRVCSVRLAETMLAKTVKYKTQAFASLKSICERSVLATLVPETNNGIFEIDPIITDVIIIYGEARCFPANQLLVGPKVVTEGSTKLSLVTPCKLLILISIHYQIDMEKYNGTEHCAAADYAFANKHFRKSPLMPMAFSSNSIGDAKFAISSSSILKFAPVQVESNFMLSDLIHDDPNPNTREEFERKRRRDFLKETIETNLKEGSKSVSPTKETRHNHDQSTVDSKLPPVENVEKKST